ncbi:unnamed protein product [Linum tenue]|uniref:non-specific serine/threonine protein kinase n=1 Tax=Linum tenue TaxID=586396 RepID=A0AAV0MWS8_9ROSI|nr:unnamed protein product [Linum tenue]
MDRHSTSCALLLTILITTTLPHTTLCSPPHPKYSSCEPRTCSSGGPSISYPFWLSDQESFCGFPNFQITCNDQGYPALAISNDEYEIRDIFYPTHSLLLSFPSSAAAGGRGGSCKTPLHNLTLDRTPFHISPNDTLRLSFFYNCSSWPPPGVLNFSSHSSYPINCSTNSTHSSFAVFLDQLPEEVGEEIREARCQQIVETPVRRGELVGDGSGDYSDILEMGFVLNWTAQNCSDCSGSGGRCGFENNQFVCFCPHGPRPTSCYDGICFLGVGAAVGSVAIMLVLFLIYLRRRRQQQYSATGSSLLSRSIFSYPSSKSKVELEKGTSKYFGVQVFTYAELEEATNNFHSSNELGDGGFGTVYYGKLKDGRTVAVKRLYESNYKRVEQFMNEIEILTRLRHPNLVSLYGCTSRHSRELLLVYEYIPNGTVADHLHGEKAKPGALSWSTRMSIAVDTASALAYLHASEIIHRDVKTNNILLDENFVVKVADFGLSRLFPTDVTHVSTAPQGTPGYVDPEYHQCYQLTSRSDVFSFGVVLVELISSMPAVDITRHRHEINLSNMAINRIQGDALHELVDQSLGFQSDASTRKMMTAVAELAFQCLQSDTDLRPSMDQVLCTLLEIQRVGDVSEKGSKAPQDVRSDDASLLKSVVVQDLPLSPNSVTGKWPSVATTPNTSS